MNTVTHTSMQDHEHEGAAADCPICNSAGTEPPRSGSRLRTVRVRARDEDFRIVQLQLCAAAGATMLPGGAFCFRANAVFRGNCIVLTRYFAALP